MTSSTVIDLSGLSATEGFMIQGDSAADLAGTSVSSAGDINGDGFDDVFIGALLGDDGGNGAGEGYVVFGKASGFGTIDLSNLAPADGFVIQGAETGDWAGQSVSSAGDVNGDGFDDVIIGAAGGANKGDFPGNAHVIFGKASGFGTIDLANLSATDGFTISGDAIGDRLGSAVSSAGDVNGDGFDDIIIGAQGGDDGGADAGEAYVIFGTADGVGDIDLSSLAPEDGFIIQGDAAGDAAGRSVSSAGDVNGDGFDDLIVGAVSGDDGGYNAGEAYVVFGKASGFGTIDLTGLAPADGFVIQGDVAGDLVGQSVSAAGDVNGDGFDDLIVGAYSGDDGGLGAGEAYVVFGKASGFGSVDLSSLVPADGFIIQGDAAGDSAGQSVSGAGDVNGDGYDDLIVGAAYGDDGDYNAGEAYVIFGKASGFGTIDLTNLAPADGFSIQGDEVFGRAGQSVSAAGDVNGDGYEDLFVGAPGSGSGGPSAGAGYVIFGGAFGGDGTSVNTTGTAGADILIGGLGDDSLTGGGGADVIRAGAGDDLLTISDTGFGRIDGGTGFDSLVLDGANLNLDLTQILPAEIDSIETIDLTGSGDNSLSLNQLNVFDITEERSSGTAVLRVTGNTGDSVSFDEIGWVNAGSITEGADTFDRYVLGNAEVRIEQGVTVDFPALIDLTGLPADQGFIIQGDAVGDFAGFDVSSAGDINGDGFDDVIVGALLGDDGDVSAGEGYVVFGKASGFGTIDLSNLTSTDGFIIQGADRGDWAGQSVSSAGDVNGDGFNDVIIGAAGGADKGDFPGNAHVIFGKASGFGTIDLANPLGADGFTIQGDAIGDFLGTRVSDAGDINGDGFDDIIVGARRGDDGGYNAGEAYVLFGKGSGFGTVDLSNLAPADGFIIQGASPNDNASYSLSKAGDINGDGFDDMIIGATASTGATVIFGKASGFGTIDLANVAPADGFAFQSSLTGDIVSTAGDVNGDGFDDLILADPRNDDGGVNAGSAYVVFGKASGLGSLDANNLTSADGFFIQGDTDGDSAGRKLATAGDINGDGFDDLIIGAPYGDDGGINAGEAYVIFGKASGFGTIDLSNLAPADGFIIQGDEAGDRAGSSVSTAGDINGDGYDDLIVGAPRGDDGGPSAGEAYVIFGGAFGGDGTSVNTTGTAGADILIGGLGDDSLTGGGGADVIRAGAGDDLLTVSDTGFGRIDGGTGFDSLVLDGANLDLDLTQILPAEINSIETIDLTGSGDNSLSLNQLNVFDITEERSGGTAVLRVTGNAGDSVSFDEIGWVNAGSITEGADTFDRYVLGNAEVRVEQGVTVDFPSLIDLTGLPAEQGFIIQGDANSDAAGRSVSNAGDVNGDGFDDVIVGAFLGNDGGVGAGEGYVVFGKASGFGTVDLSNLAPSDGFIIQGADRGDGAGQAVSSAGDMNGDGFDDIIIGAAGGANKGDFPGNAHVIFGKASGFGTIDLASPLGSDGFTIQGDAIGDFLGTSVSDAGDINGDGFDDIIVGARRGDDGGYNAGEAYVLFGKGSGFGTVDLSNFAPADGFIIQGAAPDDNFSISISKAGDLNGDGFDDMIVGATASTEAAVIYGKASGFGNIDLANLAPADGFLFQSSAAGRTVSTAGDVNGDGFDDLILSDGTTTAGGASVVFGKASGLENVDLTNLAPADGFSIQGDMPWDGAGGSVATAGDINGDGFDDLIIGAAYGDDGGDGAGEAYVVFGKSSGFGTIDLSNLAPADGFIIQGDEAGDRAGTSVSTAGDVNGDGYDDLILGAPRGDDGGPSAGEAYVIFGGAFGGDGTSVNTTGTAGADILIGGLGDDSLTGGGGADVIRAGAGDDLLTISDTGFGRIDGGNGLDTLVMDGANIDLDFTLIDSSSRVTGIEAIDLTGSGDNSTALGIQDLLQLSDETSDLLVFGDSGDAVTLSGDFLAVGSEVVDGTSYDVYASDSTEARLLAESDVTIILDTV
ncbi:integrin alpha [Denitrobaculum tricleocarpae]|uniref:FG-GAP repeat protein n=1 Tax=Denitrobaculum tricleocarpae TaxID=2591009 RepID=A0A545TQZ8_9PROT|nr:integrin alpha [Denitrobaculum tricleocarpae]TQV79645.1 hypothetical protein FKG95_13080 [Denitrobaculum tricleocarpae]